MFGYVTINKNELKIKDFNRYQSFYCGLCRELGEVGGIPGKLSLTYDMTFLVILLTALYEEPLVSSRCRCLIHPTKRHETVRNKYTRYAADMTVLLSYENLRDDWTDERDVPKLLLSKTMEGAYKKVSAAYPRQKAALNHYIERLHALEQAGEKSLDAASGATGEMLSEIFVCEADMWSGNLREMGFYLGKFIYLMDAYDDMEKDLKKNSYNPLKNYYEKPEFDDIIKEMLTLMASECARAMERLPILKDVELLRNILYSGIWAHYERIRYRRNEDKKDVRPL